MNVRHPPSLASLALMQGLIRAVLCVIAVGLGGTEAACGQSGVDLWGNGRAAGLGHTTAALAEGTGVHANPAAGAGAETRRVAFFGRQSYGLAALRYGSVSLRWPQALWDWQMTLLGGASTFGGEGYREGHYSLGIARTLSFGTSRAVSAGLLVRYYHTRIEGYGAAGAVGLHVGALFPLLPALRLGVHATNINAPALTKGEPLPQTLALGLHYRVRSGVQVVADVFKDLSFPASLRGGVEVRPLSPIALRAGITSSPVRFTGGVGLRLRRLRVHLAAEQHRTLGWSPAGALSVRW